MLEESLVCPPDPSFPLFIAAKRYSASWVQSRPASAQAITLILLHSTSFHKEIWEPTLAYLFGLSRDSGVTIGEAYAIDCPNHGVSAVLNDGLLKDTEFGCQFYAESANHFLTHCGVDFSQKHIIGIGHSLGGVSVTILHTLQHPFKFISVILVEPMFIGGSHRDSLRSQLVNLAYERRDIWSSREKAFEGFLKSRWHPKVAEVFVKYGIRDHCTTEHSVAPYKGVTLACTRDQEALMYRDKDGSTKPISELNIMCSQIPVHIIWGGLGDYIPREAQQALIDPNSGRRFASVAWMPSRGHLVLQQDPEGLASELARILESTVSCSKLRPGARL